MISPEQHSTVQSVQYSIWMRNTVHFVQGFKTNNPLIYCSIWMRNTVHFVQGFKTNNTLLYCSIWMGNTVRFVRGFITNNTLLYCSIWMRNTVRFVQVFKKYVLRPKYSKIRSQGLFFTKVIDWKSRPAFPLKGPFGQDKLFASKFFLEISFKFANIFYLK